MGNRRTGIGRDAGRAGRLRRAKDMVEADLVIRGGTIVDGQGGEPFEADIAIIDGRIAMMDTDVGRGREEIDARDLLVTPGFVDVHTHYDGQITWSDSLVPSTDHGVTTVVIGN